jgi:hypothetical protein
VVNPTAALEKFVKMDKVDKSVTTVKVAKFARMNIAVATVHVNAVVTSKFVKLAPSQNGEQSPDTALKCAVV